MEEPISIVQDILRNREKGTARLVSEYRERLYSAAFALCRNTAEAEDLVFRTFEQVVCQIETCRNEHAFYDWMYAILLNAYRNSVRGKMVSNSIPVGGWNELEGLAGAVGSPPVAEKIDGDIVREVVDTLSPRLREVVVLHYFMDQSVSKIAKFLSVADGTVMSRLHYARIALAQRLGAKLKKPAVALIAVGLILAASATTVWTMVRTVVAEDEDDRLKTVDVIEATLDGALPDGKVSFASEPVRPENDLAPTTSTLTTSPLTTSTAKGKEVMNIRQQAATALAATTLAVSSASATTVAWYHFNEGEEGYAPTGYPGIVTNAVAPGTLTGHPYRQTGCMSFGGTAGDGLPMYSGAFPTGMVWYDPVTGECDTDGMGMYFHTVNGDGSGNGAAVLVTDDERLHCEHITVECFAKIVLAPGKTKLKNQTHLLTMRNADMASTPNKTKNIKAWGLFVNASGTLYLAMQTPLADGSGPDSSRSFDNLSAGSNFSLMDGNWHHVAFTYDGETARLYVDHVLAASKAWSNPISYGTPSKNRLCIGTCDAASYSSYWQGYIDEVRITAEALSPEQFLRVRDTSCDGAIDSDTALYLPFNNMDFRAYNSATSAAASKVSISLSTSAAGIFPRIDIGAEAIVAEQLHSGIFAENPIANIGCWTFTNNLMGAAYVGKARHILIDDYSKNNGEHLITSGDFTAECWIKVPETPVTIPRILAENSGSRGAHTLDIRLDSSALHCTLVSQKNFLDYDTNTAVTTISSVDTSVPISDVADGDWHHIALVVNRTHKLAGFYFDGKLVGKHENFVLASSVSTVNEGHKKLKIGDGYGGNNTYGLHNMSIDEFRITRRALAPQEFLAAGAPVDQAALEPTRTWIGFEGDLGVEPGEGAIPEGTAPAAVSYSPVVPGERIVDGSGNVIRSANLSSMQFSASGRVFFDRNILLEKEMTAQTVEFFMKGTNGSAKAWAYLVRLYSNTAGAENAGERMWTIGYSDAAGHLYVLIDNNGSTQPTCYVDSDVRFADGRWHHVAVTFEPDGNGNTRCKVYKDYAPVKLYHYAGSTKMPLNETHTFSGPLEMADHGYSCMALGNNYNGWIDEVRISKGVLTVDQMMHVYKRGTVISVR